MSTVKTKNVGNMSEAKGVLGCFIRKARVEKGLTGIALAKACGCSPQFISNIERGVSPLPWPLGPKVAEVLGVPVGELQAANLAVTAAFHGFLANGGDVEILRRTA